MKTSKIALLCAAAFAAAAHAGTKTWTGAAGTLAWGTAGNWDPSGVPAETDDVVIDGAAVTATGSRRIPNTLTLLDGASVEIANEIQFGNSTVPNPTIVGGTVSGKLVAAQYAGAVLTIRDAAIVDTATGNNGFWQNGGSYLDFEDGESRAASFTYNSSLSGPGSDPWWFFCHTKGGTQTDSQPCIRYNGAVIDKDAYDENFQATDNGDGTVTLSMKAATAYGIASPAVAGIGETAATISAFVSKTDPGATVYALWGATAGATDDISSWDHAESAGEAVAGNTFTKALSGLTPDALVHYAFALVADGEVVAATAVKTFTPSAYSAVFTDATGDGLWETAANWRDGAVPTQADTIRIDADCTRGGNFNLQDWDVTVNGAALAATGEITPGPRTVRDGGLSATVYVAGGAGNAIVVRGSRIVSTTTGRWNVVRRGFYGTDPHFDFRSGSESSYTYTWDPDGDPPVFEEEFAAVFVAGKILVDGVALAAADADRVSFSVDSENHTATFTLLETVVDAAFDGISTAAVSGLSATLSATVELGGGKPLYVLFGTNATDLAETLVAAEAADATTYAFATNGVEGTLCFWQFRLGEADDPDAVLDSAEPQSFFASASGNLFVGAASEHANDARNWSKGAVPSASDVVYVIADVAKRGTMQWDLVNATVAGWVQVGERVTFHTSLSNVLTVAGDVSLSGGANWTHTGPSEEPDTIVNVAVSGDLAHAADSVIQAGTGGDAGARQSRGWTRGCGPGYLRDAGGSHAGDGGHVPSATSFVSYGSVLDPVSWGSGGWGDGNAYAGGGAVKLVVGGTLAADGAIQSRGFGYPLDSEDFIGGAGSGGSVNIAAGALEGSGAIDANGGNNGLYGPGSGGRVRVALTGANATFADFSGTIEALGGSLQNATQAGTYDISPAAAGTVCLSVAGGAPVVKVRNVWRYGDNDAAWRIADDPDAVPSGTHLPSMEAGADSVTALLQTRWELSDRGALRITRDVRIASLSAASDDGSQLVYTDGHVLATKELTVAGATMRSGRYTAADLPGLVAGAGAIVVDAMPTVVVVR